MRTVVQTLLDSFTSRLRFPQLFAVAAILFVIDLLIFDPIPFLDELLLGLLAALLGSLKRDRGQGEDERDDDGERPVKDVTPRS